MTRIGRPACVCHARVWCVLDEHSWVSLGTHRVGPTLYTLAGSTGPQLSARLIVNARLPKMLVTAYKHKPQGNQGPMCRTAASCLIFLHAYYVASLISKLCCLQPGYHPITTAERMTVNAP